MKKINRIIALSLSVLLFSVSCQDEEPTLGEMPDKSEIDFEVIQDYETDPGGNTVILKNNTDGTVSMWDYGTGRSTRRQDTVRFAFKGEYTIKFSAMTAGGIVTFDPVTIEVTDDNLNYVNDPLYTLLTGGPGNEKTWLLDANENGDSKFFTSPAYFSGNENANSEFDGTNLIWTKVCNVADGPGEICFTYEPNYKSDTWVASPADYGYMTFSLKGGPFVTVDHKGISGLGEESGTYFLDINSLELTMTDATAIGISWAPNDAENMGAMKLLSISENTMQLAFRHKTKPEYLIMNYISKEYSDNWVPAEPPADPNFDHGDQGDIVSVTVTTSKTWKLDPEVPYNWASLEGAFLNNWSSRADIIATGWAPYGDGDVVNIDEASITFSEDGNVTVEQDDGSTASGTYAIDEPTNTITFSGVTPAIPIASWVTVSTTDANQWKIVIVERDEITNEVTGIWFGKRDPEKSEYMVFHFLKE